MNRRSRTLPRAGLGYFLLGLVFSATLYGWWQSTRPEPWAMRFEVLPENVLEVEAPDWDALAAWGEENGGAAPQEGAAEGDAPPAAAGANPAEPEPPGAAGETGGSAQP